MLTILSGRDARRGKGFLENAENAHGATKEDIGMEKKKYSIKEDFQCQRYWTFIQSE